MQRSLSRREKDMAHVALFLQIPRIRCRSVAIVFIIRTKKERVVTKYRSRRDFLKQASLLTAASGSILKSAWAADNDYVVAETAFGKIRGVDSEGIKIFKGVPYGASTAGKNRFMPPTNPAKWTGVRDTLAYGRSAPQTEPG